MPSHTLRHWTVREVVDAAQLQVVLNELESQGFTIFDIKTLHPRDRETPAFAVVAVHVQQGAGVPTIRYRPS